MFKRLVGQALGRLGYEVRRKGQGFHADAFEDQSTLLAGRDVATVFDLGANAGAMSTGYRARFPSATVHAFEPFSETFRTLASATAHDPKIKANQLAVGKTSGRATFYITNSHFSNSLLPPSSAAAEFLPDSLIGKAGSIEVESTTLDDYCAREGIASIDLLKMDIQGGELLALKGATRLLDAHAIELIYLEVNFAPFYDGQASFAEILSFLAPRNYLLYGLYNLNLGRNSVLSWCDAIFIGPRIRAKLRRD